MYMHGILLYRTVISVLVVTAVVLYFVLTRYSRFGSSHFTGVQHSQLAMCRNSYTPSTLQTRINGSRIPYAPYTRTLVVHKSSYRLETMTDYTETAEPHLRLSCTYACAYSRSQRPDGALALGRSCLKPWCGPSSLDWL